VGDGPVTLQAPDHQSGDLRWRFPADNLFERDSISSPAIIDGVFDAAGHAVSRVIGGMDSALHFPPAAARSRVCPRSVAEARVNA
jgi:hypothetical protein